MLGLFLIALVAEPDGVRRCRCCRGAIPPGDGFGESEGVCRPCRKREAPPRLVGRLDPKGDTMRRTFTGIAALVAALTTAVLAQAGNGTPVNAGSANPIDLAVIGDTPYGAAQLEAFPALVDAIGADPKVRLVLHAGDIKSGGGRCDDSYFDAIAAHFATFRDPLVYTPGDNEWTDCHRASNGGYNPLERLQRIRERFFAEPGVALGSRGKRVLAQPGYPENQLWLDSQVVFAAVHVVGSNNGYAPWTGRAEATPEQRAEVDARIAAALGWISDAFALAEEQGARGVVLLMQADTFEGANETLDGFDEIVALMGEAAKRFGKPVLLLQGDTHSFLVDTPYAQAPNLTRIVVEGGTVSEWLRVRVDPRSPQLFSWERVPVGGGA